jgi:hypothetical protein
MLKPINKKSYDGTAWCVPSAVSMITGQSLLESHRRAAVLQHIDVGDVSGMWDREAALMLYELGYTATPIDLVSRYAGKTPCGPTLKRFLNERTREEYASVLYITVHGHALTAHMGYVGDNSTGRPVPMDRFPKLGRLTKSAYIIRSIV